jgi:hypothetical protein
MHSANGTPTANADAVSVTLQPTAGGGAATGTASVTYNAQGHYLTVHVTAGGLPPTTAHAVQIADGTCAAPGATVYVLPELVAALDGKADLTDTVANVDTPLSASHWYLVVLQAGAPVSAKAGGATPSSQPLLCADLHR